MSALLGVLMLVFCVVLIRLAKPRPDGSRPPFMQWYGMEATVAMVCTTVGAIGFGLAAEGVVNLLS